MHVITRLGPRQKGGFQSRIKLGKGRGHTREGSAFENVKKCNFLQDLWAEKGGN